MRDRLTMDFNALDLLASAAILQTRDSDNSGSSGTDPQSETSEGSSEQSADNDEDGDSKLKLGESTEDTMGSMKKQRNAHVSPNSEVKQMLNDTANEFHHSVEIRDNMVSSKMDSELVSSKMDSESMPVDENSDTDSCMEEDMETTNSEDPLSVCDADKLCRSKTIMRSLLTGQTVCEESDKHISESNMADCKTVNCDEKSLDYSSVLGSSQLVINKSAIGLIISDKSEETGPTEGLLDVGQKKFSDKVLEMNESNNNDAMEIEEKCNSANLHDSALESSQSVGDSSPSLDDTEALHFLVVSDHCYASVPGKITNLRYSILEGDDQESDSGIDGNSSSEEAENRTRSLSLDSNCLQCGFPELSGRSGQLLSQGSSDLDRSPVGHSSYPFGLSVLSPTLSSSDSQCSDYHHTGVSLIENASLQKYDSVSICDGKQYKTVDFDLDNSMSSTNGDAISGNDLSKVGKFRIGKFASFTNIDDSDSEKIFSPDPFSGSYGISPSSSAGMPASPGIPSLLQSPCGDWDRSDAGSEALDDFDSIPTLEEPKELMLGLQGMKSPHAVTPVSQASLSTAVHHDHDYCFRSGLLPVSPLGINRKGIKSEKRKYMTAARSRGTNAYMKEPKKPKTVKIKNKKGLSETIEKVKNSLASNPVTLDCNFKKPEQPANAFLLDKLTPMGRQRRLKSLDIKEEESDIELDSGSKLKITGKFQNDFVYFLNKTSRNRRRASAESASESRKHIQPAKPIDIIVPHLTDDDLEVLLAKGRVGLATLEKFSSNPHLLDRFSATLQHNKVGVTDTYRLKHEKNNAVLPTETIDDDKIINTILSMESDNLGSPGPIQSDDNDFYGVSLGAETINFMGENMTLTRDEVDLLMSAVKNVSSHEEFIGDKIHGIDDHRSTCSTEILDSNNVDVANQEWTSKADMLDKPDDDTESTYSSSDIGHSSSVSDIKEDSQESFELKDSDVTQVKDNDEMEISSSGDSHQFLTGHANSDSINSTLDAKNDLEDQSTNVHSDLVEHPPSIDRDLVDDASYYVDKSGKVDTNVINKDIHIDSELVEKPIDNDLNHLALADTKPDKILLDSELNGFSTSLVGPSLSDLGLPLEKSFELLGSEFRLDKADDLFPEAHVEPPPMEASVSDYHDTPWVVTVTVFWNDLPAIMINNRPYIRLVDIHKQILPAKDTGILKKRCQLLNIHVLNCTEMQRYFLVQYGRGYNSKSTLIVFKADACQLVGYYAQPQPRVPRTEDTSVLSDLSRLSRHMAFIRSRPHGRLIKKKRSGSRAASQNTSPERKESGKNGVVSVPPSPRVRRPPPPVVQTEVSKRLRHKKINFLEMLKGDSAEKVQVDRTSEKKMTAQATTVNKRKVETIKKVNRNNKKKEVEIEFSSETSSEEEVEDEETVSSIDEDQSEDGDEEEEEEEEEEASEHQVKHRNIMKAKNRQLNSNKSPVTIKRSPNSRSPNCKRAQLNKLGPLRVNVKGLLHFPKPVKTSAMTKNESRDLDVVHMPFEFTAGIIPISQTGLLFLDLYKKKSSLCVRCTDCQKLLSVTSFLQHQHYPEDSKTLTAVLETQTLVLKCSDLCRGLKQSWEEFQKRHEKFEGCRFLKPVVKPIETTMDAFVEEINCVLPENVANMEAVNIEDNVTESHDDEKPLCEPPVSVNSNSSEQVCVGPKSEILEDSLPPLTISESVYNTEDIVKSDNSLDASDLQESVTYNEEERPTEDENKPCSSPVPTTTTVKDSEITRDGLDKSSVRSSSRKRKSRQYFSFEDYSFSNKKTKQDDSECK